MGPFSFVEPRDVVMSLTHDCGMIHFDAALMDHLGRSLVADPALATPTDADQDDFDWKPTTLEYGQHLNAPASVDAVNPAVR